PPTEVVQTGHLEVTPAQPSGLSNPPQAPDGQPADPVVLMSPVPAALPRGPETSSGGPDVESAAGPDLQRLQPPPGPASPGAELSLAETIQLTFKANPDLQSARERTQ